MVKIRDTPINNRNISHLVTFESLWEDRISCFVNIRGIEPYQITLRHWIRFCIKPIGLKSEQHKSNVEKYRLDKNVHIKRNLPAISPGAIMKTRDKNIPSEEKILSVTGWMQFDIDLKDNAHIKDASQLRDQVKNIIYVAFCALSVSGNGIWGLIKVESPDKYKEHFEQLKIDFRSRGIILDKSKGGNPTDLRIYSYDPDAYIAEKFRIYDRLYEVRKKQNRVVIGDDNNDTRKQVEQLISEIQNKNIDLAPDYSTYRNIGFALANEFGEEGRCFFHSICSINVKYNEKEAEEQYSNCVKASGKGITISTFFYLCKQAGIIYKR